MQRIVITGPESCGKTTLTKYLAVQFDTVYVPEYARIYLEEKGTKYQQSDLVNIAIGQLALSESITALAKGKSIIFLDTWMQELRIWSQYRFGSAPDIIENMYTSHLPDFYLLCTPDLIWEADPLRENPHDRKVLCQMYERDIVSSGVPFVKISGTGAKRWRSAVEAVRRFVGDNIDPLSHVSAPRTN